MALKAGRVGVRSDQVDLSGQIIGGGSGPSADVQKLKTQVSDFYFRIEEGQAQYKPTEDSDWVNFSGGGGGAALLWENDAPDSGFSDNVISLDLTNYTYAIVIGKPATNKDNNGYTILRKNANYNSIIDCGLYEGNNNYKSCRVGKIVNNNIEFTKQYGELRSPDTISTEIYSGSEYAIPLFVYGINLSM